MLVVDNPLGGGKRKYSSLFLKRLAATLAACGETAIWHFLLDCERGRPFIDIADDFSRLRPATVRQLVARIKTAGGAQ
jgi:hypothetical protein